MNEDKVIGTKDWVDLNTLFGITVGTAVRILNQSDSQYTFRIAESATEPASDRIGYKVTPLVDGMPSYGVLDVDAGSDRLWVKAENDRAVIAVFTDF